MAPLLPPSLRALLPPELERRLPRDEVPELGPLIEVRLGAGRPVELCFAGASRFLGGPGRLVREAAEAWIPDEALSHRLLQRVAQGSLYALEEELQQGFLTLPGGHRLGLAGQVVPEGRGHRLIHVGSVNLRLARACPGAALPLLEALAVRRLLPPFPSLLVVGPPGSGKTTLLRDLIRLASEGVAPYGLEGLRVGVVDERSEIAACHRGVPRHALGPRTDVLDGAPKVAGLMQLIRTMDPQVVATDEIGSPEDAAAVLEARKAGVTVLATAHGGSLEELAARPGLSHLLDRQAFDAACLLDRSPHPGTVAAVYPRPHIPRPTE